MMITLYGIKTCTTCREAWKWLDAAGIDYAWIDLRKDGVPPEQLEAWRSTLGDATLINKRSKIWREFDAGQRAATETEPVSVLATHPILIKRPILETSHETLAGFSAARYEAVLGGNR